MRFFAHFIFALALFVIAQVSRGATQVRMWDGQGNGIYPPSITNVPPGLTNAVAIAAGSGHTLALTSLGTVVGWGDNTYGQISIPSGLSNVVAISAFSSNSVALTAQGEVVLWGTNDYGCQHQATGLTNIVSIGGGTYLGFGLREDGTHVIWGCIFNGDGSVEWGLRPLSGNLLPPDTNSVITVSYEDRSRVSLDSSGVARSRFLNNGSTNLMTNLVSVAIGVSHVLGLTADWRVLSFHSDPFFPYAAPEFTNAVAVAAGFVTSLVLTADGKLIGWNMHHLEPNPVTRYQGTNVLAIAAGGRHQVALLDLDGPPSVGQLMPGPRVVTNGVAIPFPTERGRIYLLEHKAALADNWAFQQLVAGNGGLREVVVPAAAQGFFRTRRVR